MNKQLKKLVKDVLSIPTAPYCEHEVGDFIKRYAKRRGLSIREDRYGNIVVRYRKGRSRPIAITAHMDHPGFSVLSSEGRDVNAQWNGGKDPIHFPGSKVVIRAGKDLVPGRIVSELDGTLFSIRSSRPLPEGKPAFGHFDLVSCEFRGDLIYTKAADNLINCAVLLAVLDQLGKKKVDADFRAVFTRAEEVGLAGATGLVRSKAVPKTVPIVVLEASKELPGAIMGSGPVIRVGDIISVFDARLDYGIHQLARELVASDKSFAFQRQLMSGGACEATLYAVHNLPVGAMALPLGNYHNQGKRRPAPEFVSASDVVNMIRLCAALAMQPPAREPRAELLKRFDHGFDTRHAQRLIDSRRKLK
jgi:putative aminopeptidase FrvX